MSLCKTCQAPVLWVKTEGGKNIPLDGKKVANGNIDMIGGLAYVVPPDGSDRYISHFVTCPQAEEHRRPK